MTKPLLIKFLANITLEWGRGSKILGVIRIRSGYYKLELDLETSQGKLNKFRDPRGLFREKEKEGSVFVGSSRLKSGVRCVRSLTPVASELWSASCDCKHLH